MKEFLHILEKTPLFCGIEPEKILLLCRDFGCYQRMYHKGNLLWQQGDSVSAAGIVLSGRVQAERSASDGSTVLVTTHGVGALFGDILMSSEQTHSPVDIVAAEDTQVLLLPFEHMMREGVSAEREALERFRLNLMGEMSDKYWALHRKLGYLSVHGMRKRIALWLTDRADAAGVVSFSGGRELLASELSVNRSALCRELSRMRAEGLIETARGRITLLRREEIRRLAE